MTAERDGHNPGQGQASGTSTAPAISARWCPWWPGPAFRKRAPATAQLLADWPAIVGPALAAVTAPRRFASGTLAIACSGPIALELQHLAGELMARINAHLGRVTVTRLRFVQEPAALPATQGDPAAARARSSRRPGRRAGGRRAGRRAPRCPGGARRGRLDGAVRTGAPDARHAGPSGLANHMLRVRCTLAPSRCSSWPARARRARTGTRARCGPRPGAIRGPAHEPARGGRPERAGAGHGVFLAHLHALRRLRRARPIRR